jgi:hypothetical protein
MHEEETLKVSSPEINVFFSRFQYHMFYVLYTFVAYLLTVPRICLRSGFVNGRKQENLQRKLR